MSIGPYITIGRYLDAFYVCLDYDPSVPTAEYGCLPTFELYVG